MKQIDTQLLNGVIAYLATKPFNEVAEIINRLQQCPDVQQPTK